MGRVQPATGGMEPQLQLSLAGMQRVTEIPIPAISLPHFNISVCWFHPQHSSSSAFLSSLGIGTLNSLALTRCVLQHPGAAQLEVSQPQRDA